MMFERRISCFAFVLVDHNLHFDLSVYKGIVWGTRHNFLSYDDNDVGIGQGSDDAYDLQTNNTNTI